MSVLTDNGITEEYFTEYSDEYKFIKEHFDNYKNVPDIESVISQFPDFSLVEVNESERYLIDTIREEYLYSKTVPVIKQAANLLKSDANEAAKYLQNEMVHLMPNYEIPSVDIIHDKSRLDLFEDKSKNPSKWFISTGFEELDDIIQGWQQGEEFVVVVGRTGEGKSWLIVKFANHSWLLGKNVGYISPEMTANKIGYRFDTLNSHFSNTALTRGNQSSVTTEEYSKYLDELSMHPNKVIVSTPKDFNKQITVSKLRNYIMANKLDILFIDGITYLSDERYRRGDNKTTTLTNISEDIMGLSVELQVPIIVVVQANRGGIKEGATDTPELEDIRDSDGISHNATKVIALKQKDGALILTIKKNRDGKVGEKLSYIWDIDTGEFKYNPIRNDDDDFIRENKVEEQPKPKKKGKVAF